VDAEGSFQHFSVHGRLGRAGLPPKYVRIMERYTLDVKHQPPCYEDLLPFRVEQVVRDTTGCWRAFWLFLTNRVWRLCTLPVGLDDPLSPINGRFPHIPPWLR
jgi:hypothetical protein